VELLLVVVIMLISTAIAAPLIARSLENTRLRAGAKAVATAHRYARGTAVLKQADVLLLIEPDAGRVRVLRVRPATPAPAAAETTETAGGDDLFARAPAGDGAEAPADRVAGMPADAVEVLLERELDEHVRITAIEDIPDPQRWNGRGWVRYRMSGMSDNFSVRLEDAKGTAMTVRGNGLTGRVEFVE
jgi:type II secretory pathway pseudopilin PulG